jgi:N-methylhydantoinase A
MGALRIVSVERGHDPRDFTLVPFGGAGPLHGCALADLLGIKRVLIPTAPGVLCADGLLAADLKADFSRTLPRTGKVDIEVARAIYAELSRQADDWLANEKVATADRKQVRIALMRYHGQGGEVAVGWVDDAAGVEAAFAAAHRALYGFALDSAIELVTLRIEATGRMPAPLRPVLPSGFGSKPKGRHTVHFASGTTEVPLYDRATFGAGDRLDGPAIISQLDATTLVAPGWSGEVHPSGAILLTTRS